MVTRELNRSAASGLKEQVDYRDGSRCCKACKYFGEDETLGGAHDARPARCTYHVGWFQVSEAGCCDLFSAP